MSGLSKEADAAAAASAAETAIAEQGLASSAEVAAAIAAATEDLATTAEVSAAITAATEDLVTTAELAEAAMPTLAAGQMPGIPLLGTPPAIAMDWAFIHALLRNPTGMISVALSGNANDFEPVSAEAWRECWMLAVNPTDAWEITGFVADFAQADFVPFKMLFNPFGNAPTLFQLRDENVGAAANNRIRIPNGISGDRLYINPGQFVILYYDQTTDLGGIANRWVVLDMNSNNYTNQMSVTDSTGIRRNLEVNAGKLVGNPFGSLDAWDARQFQALINSSSFVNTDAVPLTIGMAVILTGEPGNPGHVGRAQASDASVSRFIGAVLDTSIAISAEGLIQLAHEIPVPFALQEGTAWVAGDEIYISAVTAGSYTNVAPSAGGTFVAPVGRCRADAGGGTTSFILKIGPVTAN